MSRSRATPVLGWALALVLIGLLVENLVFGSIERLTVKRWGVQR